MSVRSIPTWPEQSSSSRSARSGEAGSIVAAEAGKHLKKTVMELGSNDAYLVLEDADIATAVEVCTTGRIYNNAAASASRSS